MDVEYEPETGGSDEQEMEEDDVAIRRLVPVYAEEDMTTLHVSLQMNWARCYLQQKQPGDGSARANIAVALAEAALARLKQANLDR